MISLPEFHNPLSPEFTWILLTFFFARVVRFITKDDFPPIIKFRNWYDRHADNGWEVLFICPWCVGFYIIGLGYWLTGRMVDIPLPVLQAGATMFAAAFLITYSGD